MMDNAVLFFSMYCSISVIDWLFMEQIASTESYPVTMKQLKMYLGKCNFISCVTSNLYEIAL